ncbi:biotin transporter BioY, partial [Prochlorococcus sp. AH-716-E13]|nr:biotin transporter BioY [Prochlorococcus sp. AH-716-E13]
MVNYNKLIEIFISLQIIIISTFIPVYFSIPSQNNIFPTFDMPITFQIPSIMIITLIFNGQTVIKAFSIYLVIGLFFIPVFHQGGSLGYLLTPNFGYLLGIYPLIKIIDGLNKKNQKLNFFILIKYGILGISSMHLIGIIYSCIQILYFKQTDILIYNISKFSLGKFGYHLLML